MAQTAENLPVIQETQVQYLGGEVPLRRKWPPTNYSIHDWRVPWTEESGRLESMGCKELDATEQPTHTFFLPKDVSLEIWQPYCDHEATRFQMRSYMVRQ